MPSPQPGREAIEVIETQIVAYTEYAERLTRYLDELRGTLAALRSQG